MTAMKKAAVVLALGAPGATGARRAYACPCSQVIGYPAEDIDDPDEFHGWIVLLPGYSESEDGTYRIAGSAIKRGNRARRRGTIDPHVTIAEGPDDETNRQSLRLTAHDLWRESGQRRFERMPDAARLPIVVRCEGCLELVSIEPSSGG